MPSEWELEETILALRTLTDVVDDPGALAAVWGGDDEGDVGQSASDGTSDEVAGEVVGGILGDGQGGFLALEEGLEIWHAAVVDVFVRRAEAPVLRVGGKGALHVLVDEFLQIEAERPVAADDLIGTDAGVGGHIAAGVVELHVGGIVANALAGAVERGMDEPGGKGLVLRRMAAGFFGEVARVSPEGTLAPDGDGEKAKDGEETDS